MPNRHLNLSIIKSTQVFAHYRASNVPLRYYLFGPGREDLIEEFSPEEMFEKWFKMDIWSLPYHFSRSILDDFGAEFESIDPVVP